MPSWRHASFLRLSVAAGACAVVSTATRVGKAEPPSTPEPAPPSLGQPLSQSELDPTRAFAERVILLVRTPGDDGVVTRLRADLAESGWRVLEIRPDARSETTLESSAASERASAAVRIDLRRGVIELLVQRPEGPVTETIAASSDQQSDQVMALRVAEALRARGLLLAQKAPKEERTVPPDPKQPVLESSRESGKEREPRDTARLWLELGPGLSLSPGGLAPLPVVEFGLRVELAKVWSLCLDGLVPVSHQSVTGDEGEATIATWLVAGMLDVEWARFAFGGLRSGIGAGGAVTTMTGEAQSGYQGEDDTVATFAPMARSSFHVAFGRWLRLRTGVAIGATVPPVRIVFGSREVASWGRPFLVTSIVLETRPSEW